MTRTISRDEPGFPAIVEHVIAGRQVLVQNLPPALEPSVPAPTLYAPHGGTIYAVADDDGLARVLSSLRDLGCALLDDDREGPSFHFRRLRGAGLLGGAFDRIVQVDGPTFRIESGR